MPLCGCFHSYKLIYMGPGQYQLEFDLQGHVDFPSTFRASGVASRIQEHTLSPIYRLSDVHEPAVLENLCESLKSKIVINLSPSLDFCYALSPYTIFGEEDDGSSRSTIGSLVNAAKYRRDRSAINELGNALLQFIQDHPAFKKVTSISAPPKSQSDLPNLPGLWAKGISNSLQLDLIEAHKTRVTSPQKKYEGEESEEEVASRVINSVTVPAIEKGSRVLILDDTVRSGGTLLELARALRAAGATQVYGLAAAKDAKFTLGGIDLLKDSWQ